MAKYIDMLELFSDFNIRIACPGERHYREMWIHIVCPFCTGNPGNHLGWHTTMYNTFICHRCGSQSPVKVIHALLKVPYAQAYNILKEYGSNTAVAGEVKEIVYKQTLVKPDNVGPLEMSHKMYLKKRGLNVRELMEMYQIQGIPHVARKRGRLMKKGTMSDRIFIPIHLDHKEVSYQTRDITEKATNKYITCAKENEVVHHKHLCYGSDLVPGSTCIVVEGIVDAWKLGPGAICTFGIKFKQEQINFIADRYDHIGILFDQERQAHKQAVQLQAELLLIGKDTELLKIDANDAGDMPLIEARAFSKRFMDKYSYRF